MYDGHFRNLSLTLIDCFMLLCSWSKIEEFLNYVMTYIFVSKIKLELKVTSGFSVNFQSISLLKGHESRYLLQVV